MKRRFLFPLFLLLFTVICSMKEEPILAQAIPASGDVVEQLGGPVAKDCPLNVDEVLEKYNKEELFEAQFIPHVGMDIVFPGTARSFVKLPKADAELALLSTLRISGYSKDELLESKKTAAEFEASAKKYSNADFLDVLNDILGFAGNAVGGGSDLTKVAAVLSGTADLTSTITSDDRAERLLAVGDALAAAGSLFDELAFPLIGKAAAVAGTALFAVSLSYTTAKKYAEHQKLWQKFTDYVSARRKLDEFRKILDKELEKKLEQARGLDIRFDSKAQSTGMVFGTFEVPFSIHFKARFAKNCLSGDDAFLGTANDDGFVGQYTFTYEADMSVIEKFWPSSKVNPVPQLGKEYAATYGADVKKSECVEHFYYDAEKSDQYLPLPITSGKAGSGQLIFEGSLADGGSFEYHQGGKYVQEYSLNSITYFEGKPFFERRYSAKSTLTVTMAGAKNPWSFYSYAKDYASGATAPTQNQKGEEEVKGDLLRVKDTFQALPSKMVVDFTKVLAK